VLARRTSGQITFTNLFSHLLSARFPGLLHNRCFMNLINFELDTGWEARFNQYLRSNSRALDSLRALVDAGIPESWLLQILHGYGDPDLRQREQSSQRQSALSSLKEVNRVIKSLEKTSDALESFTDNSGVRDWVKDNHLNLRRDLSARLKTYLDAMTEMRDELAKLASGKGEGVSEAWLVALVEAAIDITGQPHWGDLAYMIEATYYAHHLRGEVDRDTVRKRYDRFVKNFPRIYESWSGLDWKTYFGVEVKIESATSTNPQDAMDRFIKRFSPETRKQLTTKPRYGKIHRSMKR